MRHPCDISTEELRASRAGAVSSLRGAEIRAHLVACADCRETFLTSADITTLLRTHYPIHDDDLARAAIKRQARASTTTRRVDQHRVSLRPVAVLCVVLIVGAVLDWAPGGVNGGDSFARWRRVLPPPAEVDSGVRPRGPLPVPAQSVVVDDSSLPFDLVVMDGGSKGAHRVGRTYQNTSGLVVQISVDPPESGWISTPDDPLHSERVTVDGYEALITFGAHQDDVLSALWVADDALHAIVVLSSPEDRLSRSDTLTLIRAVMGWPRRSSSSTWE